MHHPIPVSLSEKDRASLQTFIHAGKANARTFTRAHALLKAADGWTDEQICEAFSITRNTSIRVRQLYLSGGLETVLHDKKQQRLRQALTGGQAVHLIAIACTPAPDGHDHWTLRLLAGKAVELGFVDSISPETIRQMLKKPQALPVHLPTILWNGTSSTGTKSIGTCGGFTLVSCRRHSKADGAR